MRCLKKSLVGGAVAAVVAVATLAASAVPASAYVICNRWGYCRHVHRHYYPAYYGDPYYDPYYGYYGPYDPYWGPGYYGPSYGYYGYGPSISLGFAFGGGHHFHH